MSWQIPAGTACTLPARIRSCATDGIVVRGHFHEKASPLRRSPSLWSVVVMMEGGGWMRKTELERCLFCGTICVVNVEENDGGEKAMRVWGQCRRRLGFLIVGIKGLGWQGVILICTTQERLEARRMQSLTKWLLLYVFDTDNWGSN